MTKGHAGFDYETESCEILKRLGRVPRDFTPAGAGGIGPDLLLRHRGEESGCEMKLRDASAGSLVLKYENRGPTPTWRFGKVDHKDREKIVLADLATHTDLFERISKEWKVPPLLREERDEEWLSETAGTTPRDRYWMDLQNHPEIKDWVDPKTIERYYNSKGCHYLNVGTHGFFLLGKENPLGLKGVPVFSDSASASFRARCQGKGCKSYQFVFEMRFYCRARSPFNLAPVEKGGSKIRLDLIEMGCFLD